MARLLDTIPVYKPQTQNTGAQNQYKPVQTNNFINGIKNKYPQDKIYTYIPASPITPAKTTPSGVTSQPASGELIKENIFQSAGSTIKSYADYVKYFYKAAFKGEGTDYSIGKVNDLAIRAGSLGIATVLATTKLFPFAKGMEFVGLSTWFASMALWPKILAAPIKALYGVDINQKYKDSYGRRKDVFEDNQYRPMDIFRYVDVNGRPMSKEEYYKKYDTDYVYLNKFADKRKIPKNIKNRNEAAMNEMGQIAVQGKTISMLTAGFMTPVLSSLAADALQNPLKNYLNEQRYNIQNKNITQLTEKIENILKDTSKSYATNIDKVFTDLNLEISPKIYTEFESLLSGNGEMTKAEFEKLEKYLEKRYFGTGIHTSIKSAMSKDTKMTEPFIKINEQLKADLTQISKKAFKEVLDTIPENQKHLIPQEFWKYDGLSAENIDKLLKKLYIENGQTIGQHKTNALYSSFLPEVIEPFEKLQRIKCSNYKEELTEIEKEFQNAKKQAEESYKAALQAAQEQAEAAARAAGKSEEEVINAVNTAKAAVKKTKVTKRIITEETIDPNVSKVIQKIRENINKELKSYIDSHRRFIIPKDEITKLFKFAELNNQLKAKIELFEKTTIKNISESATAISWENIPQQYAKVLNFTKKELAILASADATTASKVITKKLEEIVQNPEQYKKVVETMTNLAKTAIAKDERALIKLIGTLENPGILFKTKELMETIAKENFGVAMQDSVEAFYYGRIASMQRKLRNTTDSLVRPLKTLDIFKNIDSITEYVLGNKTLFEKRQNDLNYYMFHNMKYEDAVQSFKAYIKDIILQKNDINNWTTKMEVELPGMKKGLKYSKAVLCSLSDMIYGDLHPETIQIIESLNPEKLAENREFINKLTQNNKIMRARFLSIQNPLLKFMTEENAFGNLISKLDKPNERKAAAEALLELLQDKMSDLGTLTGPNNNRVTLKKLKNYQKILNDFITGAVDNPGYIKSDAIGCLKELGALRFNTANKAISEMSGKNITDFFVSAAQNIRSRNKWLKLVYSLLGGTLAISTITILLMGKKNNLNPHIYEKKDAPQGAIK